MSKNGGFRLYPNFEKEVKEQKKKSKKFNYEKSEQAKRLKNFFGGCSK